MSRAAREVAMVARNGCRIPAPAPCASTSAATGAAGAVANPDTESSPTRKSISSTIVMPENYPGGVTAGKRPKMLLTGRGEFPSPSVPIVSAPVFARFRYHLDRDTAGGGPPGTGGGGKD